MSHRCARAVARGSRIASTCSRQTDGGTSAVWNVARATLTWSQSSRASVNTETFTVRRTITGKINVYIAERWLLSKLDQIVTHCIASIAMKTALRFYPSEGLFVIVVGFPKVGYAVHLTNVDLSPQCHNVNSLFIDTNLSRTAIAFHMKSSKVKKNRVSAGLKQVLIHLYTN